MTKISRLFAATATAALCATGATAAIVSADFRIELDLPDISDGPRVFEALGVSLGAGDELTPADETANPSGWGGAARIDLSPSGLLTLIGDQEGQGFADYDLAIFSISNIVFDTADSVSSVAELTAGIMDPAFGSPVPGPVIDFGVDFVTVTYDTTLGGDSADFELLDGGASTFQLGLSDVALVPLPASLPLLLAGLGGFAMLRRKTG